MSENLSKYVTGLDYIDSTLAFFSTVSGCISFALFLLTVGMIPVGITSAIISWFVALSNGLNQAFLGKMNKKAKHKITYQQP